MSDSELQYTVTRLEIINSTVARKRLGPEGSTKGSKDSESLSPSVTSDSEFIPHESGHSFQLFYDLWFVANLTVFTEYHEIIDVKALSLFIGFVLLLWTTWIQSTFFDARFSGDSIFERITCAFDLGVMVGFAELGTVFTPSPNYQAIFRMASLFLMASRLVLAVKYATMLFQARKYARRRAKMVLLLIIGTLVAAATIYFGISFMLGVDNIPGDALIAWNVVGVVEVILQLEYSRLSDPLSFKGTNLEARMNQLTLIILGEGIIIMIRGINLLVQEKSPLADSLAIGWSPALIAIIGCAIGLIYIIFKIYFDLDHHSETTSRRRTAWVFFHLPFHMALVVLLEGTNKFVVIWKILESSASANSALNGVFEDVRAPSTLTTQEVIGKIRSIVVDQLVLYKPNDTLKTWTHLNTTFANISTIPDMFWSIGVPVDDPTVDRFTDSFKDIVLTVLENIQAFFGIHGPVESATFNLSSLENVAIYSRKTEFKLIFIYTYISAGMVISLITLLHAISKREGWVSFNIYRTAFFISTGVGLTLTNLLATSEILLVNFLSSPWPVPVILICYSVVLIVAHLPFPKSFNGKRKGDSVPFTNKIPQIRQSGPSPQRRPKSRRYMSLHDSRPDVGFEMDEQKEHTRHTGNFV
ncbi:uncharacterized protein BCR38DRAFT_509389 [Pseudomassariella vexata]|uniref:Bacterial low temperature requirement A protein-domain-containing protein n=1 Tax=Pseudomassariella vexata TaxID=1141098 RepID=A0A1Y2E635_9PEZI|nr:uncharacterized protein BCR38DRAFT_509389 [Pseudomassariella vexata]ORY67023.1 hypothetical protein BCR38DRAFT_509389 [Pseudomassariella vexata]